MIGASFKERLAKGEVLIGCNVRHSRTAEIGGILGDCGFSWIMLDNEHSPMASHLAYDIGLGAIRIPEAELDALVAYLQVLGSLVDFATFDASGPNLR